MSRDLLPRPQIVPRYTGYGHHPHETGLAPDCI